MEDTATLTLRFGRIGPEGLPLNLAVGVDGVEIYDKDLTTNEEQVVEHTISDADGEHIVEIKLSGKTWDHTVVGPKDTILSDIAVMIEEIILEEIDVTGAALRTARLTHSFNNPTKELVTVEGTTYLGFNSITQIKFTTPAFIWMLENL